MKKNIMKLVALSTVAVLAIGALAGCGAKEPAEQPEKEVLVMGTNAAFPPFEFVTSEGIVGEFDGIDIAIAKNIADSMDKDLKIEDMEFDGLIGAVQNGKIDMAVAGMTATDARRESVDFSDTYFVAKQVIVVPADNTTINSAEDLKAAKQIGVIQGYTGDAIVSELVDESQILRMSRGIDAVQDVKNGKLDAVVIDSATGIALANENGLKVVEDAEAFEQEEYAIAVKKGNTELLDAINKVLAEMKENGEIDALAVKYNG